MHYLACGISSLLHSVNLILFTVLLVHRIMHASPPSLLPSITSSAFAVLYYAEVEKFLSDKFVVKHAQCYLDTLYLLFIDFWVLVFFLFNFCITCGK